MKKPMPQVLKTEEEKKEPLSTKKTYMAPVLIEYGDITNLINTNPAAGGDGGGLAPNSGT